MFNLGSKRIRRSDRIRLELLHRIATWTFSLLTATAAQIPYSTASGAENPRRPNIVLILTDDQGYGDLGCHGNPLIRTPNLDRFARESVRLKSFYVSPVCSPTRASLLTGRYHYRTGVVDTYAGRSLMAPDEVTLAEMLAVAGYRTGIFGKWHLGDNAPLRASDQGFQEALVIKGGGIGQASDPPGGSSYFDPILQHNGMQKRYSGYCSDVFATAAIQFVSAADTRPFFAYLAFNCPHDPLEAPAAELAAYRAMSLTARDFPQVGRPIPEALMSSPEALARVYAMVSNIDANVGRVLGALETKGLMRDTIVIFLTDNGPAQVRFNAGLRGFKGTVYEGGIHVPCYIRWPGKLKPGHVVDRITAHIDLVPTLLDACGVAVPAGLQLDGKSLLPLLCEAANASWPDRTLYFQWHRGDEPEPDRAFAARGPRYKLLSPEPPPGSGKVPPLELYDLDLDPSEEHNRAPSHPAIVQKMHEGYLAWFRDVASTRGFQPIRIEIGGARESPIVLTRQDWRGPRAGWGPNDLGAWEVAVAKHGRFDISARLVPRRFPTVAHLSLRGVARELSLEPEATACTFRDLPLTAGPGRLEIWIEGNRATAGVLDVTIASSDRRP
jgi:arylsulfatase A-like enzyme